MKKRNFERFLQMDFLIITLFLVGFLAGMLFAFVGKGQGEELEWLESLLMYLKYGEIHYGDMLFYVLKKRLTVILILVILCLSGKGNYILLAGVGLAGAFTGYYITEFIMVKGILGSLFFVVSILPHYICYVYGYYKALMLLNRKRVIKENINRAGQYEGALSRMNDRELLKTIAPFAVVIIGILLECYVNPFFVKIFLKIFM